MTTSTAAPKTKAKTKATTRTRRTPAAVDPKPVCIACSVELSNADKQRSQELKDRCEACAESGAAALVTRVVNEQPGIHEGVRVCGNCDANITTLAGAAYCSEACKGEAAATRARKAPKADTPKPLNGDVRTIVTWTIRDGLSDDQIRVGLNGAWKLREGKKFTAEAVAAAGRVWFENYNLNTYERGTRNTKVLRVLNAVRRLVEG